MMFGSSRRNLDFSKLFDYNTPPIWQPPQDGPPLTEDAPMPTGPRFGGGSMGNPPNVLSYSGYDRNAAMEGKSGFSPMNGNQPSKRPGFFGQGGPGRAILGTIGDVLLQRGGNAPIYAPAMRQQQGLLAQQQQAEQQRQQEREDYMWKSQYDRANPKPINNDTTADYDYIASKLGKDAADNYLRLKTERQQTTIIDNGDGTKTIYQLPQGGGMPANAAPPRPVGKLRPIGGQPGGNGPFVQ